MSDLPPEFQVAAVSRIVQRLSDPQGSRRFLLADEVGLGKTRVAAGVIQAMRKNKGFIVVYVCSNSEIAEQNRDKLAPGNQSASVTRLTLLATESDRIDKKRNQGELQLFSFTPGTSFQVHSTTGIARERLLLLFLLWRVWRKPVNQRRWRLFFRCNSKLEPWLASSRFRQLHGEFARHISRDLQARLKEAWADHTVRLLDPETGKLSPVGCPLARALQTGVEEFHCQPEDVAHFNRNRIIGALRECLSKVALDFLQPDLVLLDEFQKFSEILQESRNPASVVGRLFRHRNTPTLILSATPYKAYSLNHEDTKSRDELLNMLAFLYESNGRRGADSLPEEIVALGKNLDAFRDRLMSGSWFNGTDQKLLELKKEIEDHLKPVMSRTERTWYIEDELKGVQEFGARPDQLPSPSELEQYVRLRKFLLEQKIDDWNITDFWKSAPLPLVYMDGDYALIKRLRQRRAKRVPEPLLPRRGFHSIAGQEHLKVRALTDKVFGSATQPFPYLWIKPAYFYQQDDFYGSDDPSKFPVPSKFLVFSHWKFVPKAVAVLLSQEAEQRLGRPRRRGKETAPLLFRQVVSFTAFDVCYPSPILADAVNPAAWAMKAERPLTTAEVYRLAEAAVRHLLENNANKIRIRDKARSAPLWRIIARLESVSRYSHTVQQGLYSIDLKARDEKSAHYGSHRSTYGDWMDEQEDILVISNAWVQRLTRIALYSPAVCLLRSMRSVFGQAWEEKHWRTLLQLGINQLRNYFNKRVVQMVIREGKSHERSYAARFLQYCCRAHFQAVMDEYAYVVHPSLSAKKPEDLPREFLRQLECVLGMGSGSPSVNVLTRGGRIRHRPSPRPSHFAMAFGDDVAADANESLNRTRKTAMREAFNSPFWPFVLATTSVGQEGLDFHLYCRDIMHWNLPSNPVDLEQREGRINRRNSLSIRRNIASDHPLASLPKAPAGPRNLWTDLFAMLRATSSGIQRFKHGLYPHWIYQTAAGGSHMVRRHLAFYANSRDVQRYENLKVGLSLYRLVFGQPRQQDVLENLLKQHPHADPIELSRRLARYIINLSPIPERHAVDLAKKEARVLLDDPPRLERVLAEVRALVEREAAGALQSVLPEIQHLLQVTEDEAAYAGAKSASRLHALEALLYLLNPYDDLYDFHDGIGYQDDIAKLRQVHASLFPPTEVDQTS